MHFRLSIWISIVLLVYGLQTSQLFADGGSIQFRQSAGPFIITLFAASAPLHAGPADLSVLVESAASNRPLLDADVALGLKGPGASRTLTVTASRTHSINKLLYTAVAEFPVPGDWTVSVRVAETLGTGEARGTMTILPARAPLSKYWPYFAILPLLISLFVLNQWLAEKRVTAYKRRKDQRTL